MKNKVNLSLIVILFLLIQPFFDLYNTYGSVSTLIRVIFITVLFGYTLYKFKDKKALNLFLIYIYILFLFFIMHNLNALSFKSLVPNNFNYSIYGEMLYFFKMINPLMLIYVVYKNFNVEDKKYLLPFVMTYSGIIVITNLLGVSYSTYESKIVRESIFSWFNNDSYNYLELATKGLFYFANHIIMIIIIFLPIVLKNIFEKINVLNISSLLIILLSLLMLGNKTSTYGTIIILLSFLILYLFFNFRKIDYKKASLLLIITCSYSILTFFSPAYYRIITKENTMPIYKWPSENNLKTDYILKNYESKKIYKKFILESYPYKYDPDFWIGIMKEDESKRIDYRFIEKSMIERIIKLNNNENDKYFGIGYTRHMNIFSVEIDYLNQYYSVGIIGLILLIFPYIGITIFLTYIFFKKENFNFENSVYLMGIYLFLLLSYYTGNMFNSLSVMIPFAFILGILLNTTKKCGKISKEDIK